MAPESHKTEVTLLAPNVEAEWPRVNELLSNRTQM